MASNKLAYIYVLALVVAPISGEETTYLIFCVAKITKMDRLLYCYFKPSN